MDLHEELWGLVGKWRDYAKNPYSMAPARNASEADANMLERVLRDHNIPRPRRCGDCGWWERYQEPGDLAKFGSCTHPLPVCLKNQAVVAQREDEDTQGCKCFKPRD